MPLFIQQKENEYVISGTLLVVFFLFILERNLRSKTVHEQHV